MATIWPESTLRAYSDQSINTTSSSVRTFSIPAGYTSDDYLVVSLQGIDSGQLSVDGLTNLSSEIVSGRYQAVYGGFKDAKTTLTVRSAATTARFVMTLNAVTQVNRSNPVKEVVVVAEAATTSGAYTPGGARSKASAEKLVGITSMFYNERAAGSVNPGGFVFVHDNRPEGAWYRAWGSALFAADGSIQTANSSAPQRVVDTWLSSGSAADYEAYFTINFGAIADFSVYPPINTWRSLTNGLQVVSKEVSQENGYPTQIQSGWTVKIRKAGTTAVLATWEVGFGISSGIMQ